MGRKSRVATVDPTIFNCFKPSGPTSFDIINHFKRNLPEGYGKIGHFGTLDPFASGVLLIGIGGATKLTSLVSKLPKSYIAVGKLGTKTDSGDLFGNIVSTLDLTSEVTELKKDKIEEILRNRFLGTYMQPPPFFSASKHKGKPLYSYARSGVLIQKEAVKRTVFDIKVLRFVPPYLSIKFTVSSGTYIRTLFEDCAEELGTNGFLIGLVRESIGDFSIKNSIYKKDWPLKSEASKDYPLGLALDSAFSFNEVRLPRSEWEKFEMGVSPSRELFKNSSADKFWLKTDKDRVAALLDVGDDVSVIARFQHIVDSNKSLSD